MRCIKNKKGVSLVELMITLAVFSIIMSMVYSVYNAFLKHATTERKAAKTEMDVVNVAWPLVKEIQSAGFGVPSSGTCSSYIDVSGNELTIHSAAAGDSQHAGKWSYVGSSCSVTGLPASENVAVINNLDKSLLVYTTVTGTNTLSVTCEEKYVNQIAYWIPNSNPGCYETKYYLYSGTAPAMCAPNTLTLGRKVSTTAGGGTVQPMLDCALSLGYRFGCIDTSGNLAWRTDKNCGTAKLRLVKIGMIIQSSPRRDSQVPATITLFEDLGATLQTTINLDSIDTSLRYYKWRKIEQTITLRNLE